MGDGGGARVNGARGGRRGTDRILAGPLAPPAIFPPHHGASRACSTRGLDCSHSHSCPIRSPPATCQPAVDRAPALSLCQPAVEDGTTDWAQSI
jgi:hypothetical protein